jgi:hypothetical protein
MKHLILVLFCLPFFVFSQDLRFEINTPQGFIENTYIIDDNTVIKISETIDEIYVFRSHAIAKSYLQTLNASMIPKIKFELQETSIFIDSVVSVDYYTNKTPSGSTGQIKSINNMLFTYAPDYSWNVNSGIVGKLTQIGNNKITYWTSAGYAEKGKYRGKIKSFGDKQFEYEGWSSWGEKAVMVGRVTSVGTITIKYYDTDYDQGYKGKLKSIGAVKFVYFGETFNNKKANIVGKFKLRTGQDKRFIVH